MEILVNGARKALQFDGQPLSFDGLVVLAGFERLPSILVEWKKDGRAGDVKPGQVITARQGMRFSVIAPVMVQRAEIGD